MPLYSNKVKGDIEQDWFAQMGPSQPFVSLGIVSKDTGIMWFRHS